MAGQTHVPQQRKPSLDAHHISQAKTQYGELRRVLTEIG